MLKCPNGTYAAGWDRRTSCTSCGTNIHSMELQAEEYLAGPFYIRASPQDCCKYAVSSPVIADDSQQV
jgi:hypothetical protein